MSLNGVCLRDSLIFGHRRAGGRETRKFIGTDRIAKHGERALVFQAIVRTDSGSGESGLCKAEEPSCAGTL